jgi:hypothetical protein
MIDRERFPAADEFSPPHEIDEILDLLPAEVTLNVPDQILSLWFPPGPIDGVMEGSAREQAQNYAHSCGCKFRYRRDIGEGLFYR